MADNLTLKDASVQAERYFRRALAVILATVVFLVGAVFIANLVGDSSVGDQWLWVLLAAGFAIYGFYAAQADNRDHASGLIVAVVTSTAKDLATVALGTLAVAAALATFGITTFGAIVAGATSGLIAQWVFKRIWVRWK